MFLNHTHHGSREGDAALAALFCRADAGKGGVVVEEVAGDLVRGTDFCRILLCAGVTPWFGKRDDGFPRQFDRVTLFEKEDEFIALKVSSLHAERGLLQEMHGSLSAGCIDSRRGREG